MSRQIPIMHTCAAYTWSSRVIIATPRVQNLQILAPVDQVSLLFVHILSGLTGTLSGVQALVPSWLASGPPSATAGETQTVPSATPSTPVPAASPSLVPTQSSSSLDGSTESTVDFLLPSSDLPPISAK